MIDTAHYTVESIRCIKAVCRLLNRNDFFKEEKE
jgi:hypothetical protein